ncbi:putative membrane protein [Yersinia pestis PY-13]|uniref:Membrane protein n=2 Tax=Yersinia pestis TaxID=632 RepID=A0AB72ZKV0_YERPE|nr:hypothetical protein YpAngola_A2515 [Yersinia pestis Angola]EDR30951.1 hypothetical protein YPIP275_3018 [Yersinia pestis biovar Orientalis str. IP275]EDR44282.1 hypothetical protein YpE1979001_0337 [Yersinia pestis biovar Antiqua str. E1979001]EDR52811.1 hypothetical protein YpB42003004_1359 [Yersinia pestis biovar Antiqua str. B42003004]EDR58010.1 hypothetical protein YpMG051020_3470 [Yersinia pestis biovar Orientalis str. MG05-1020]EEO90420.1 hypothetical protein YPS_2423 [Yersinia pesti
MMLLVFFIHLANGFYCYFYLILCGACEFPTDWIKYYR